jgi:hypothetical protein
MKTTKNKLLLFLFLVIIFLATSCRGVQIKHGKDCGCGSFGQIEQTQAKPQ